MYESERRNTILNKNQVDIYCDRRKCRISSEAENMKDKEMFEKLRKIEKRERMYLVGKVMMERQFKEGK